MDEQGKRYSRRKHVTPAAVQVDRDLHHIFSGATERYKAWAVTLLEGKSIPAAEVIAQARADGWINEGAALRSYVEGLPGTQPDDSTMLAARIYELCRIVEEFQLAPDKFTLKSGMQSVFELGRVSMLAQVYGIDEKTVTVRVERAKKTNTKFTDDDRERWRALRSGALADRTARDAARIIAKREGRPDSQAESIRKAFG